MTLWIFRSDKLAIEQTSGCPCINIHGVADLETGQTRMIEALTIDATSTVALLESIEAMYPILALIHVFFRLRALSSRQARARPA
ncbi:MAG: hypothetical protein EXR05_10240 [Acetobacteraceae bacterium]|nr:hypothetical protein [Acetobacteraceae bacterium]